MIKLISEENCCKTTVTFNEYNQEKEEKYLSDFRANSKIRKITRVENDEEVILLERWSNSI